MHLFVALGGVCIFDVGLVNPKGVAQYRPVLVASYRGERAAPPLVVRLVADATQLGRALDGDDGAHESNESDPDREHLSAVLEDGAGEGGEAPPAAARLVDGLSVQQDLVGSQARHEHPEGIRSSHTDLSHPPRTPTRRDCRQTKIRVGARANSLFGSEGHSIRVPCGPRIITCYLNY